MRAFTALTIAAAVSTIVVAAQSKPPAAPGSDAAIRAVADQYAKASLAGDAKAVVALYTDDAIEMPPNRPMIKGRAAVLKYYEEQFAAAKINTLTFQHLDSHSSGDTGYDVGTYSQTLTPTKAAAMNDTGKYTVVLKRVGGAWKVAYAIYNSDLPPPAAGR